MSDAVELASGEISGEGSHFSPGLEVQDEVTTDATLDAMQEACGSSRPGSLAFILKPLTGNADTCFGGTDEIRATLNEARTASLKSRIAYSRLTPHGKMVNALPIFARELADHCEADGLAIRSLTVQFLTPNDMLTMSQGPRRLSSATQWHTDARPDRDPDGTILPPLKGSQKLVVAKTISLDDTAHFNNGVQSIRGAIDTTRALTFATRVELDDYTQGSPDETAIDVWGKPLYVPDTLVPADSIDTVPEGRVANIPETAVHRANPEMTVDETVQGRFLLSAFLRPAA